MSETIIAVADGRRMGEVEFQSNRLRFCYAEDWQRDPTAFPLSLSMPLAESDHPHPMVEAFLWGLLPDNDGVLDRWGRRFHVSPRNPFRLLQHVGEDCAGAIQFLHPDRVDELLKQGDEPSVEWLTEKDVETRIRAVVEDASITRLGTDAGQFSLAGAQPKTALYFDRQSKRWGVPEGKTPTTHILKPATGAYDGQTENEHFCLSLAGALGFAAAQSSVTHWGDVPVIVVERFDRVWRENRVRRVHQEDFCQASGIRPQNKYENQGGPSPKTIAEIIWTCSSSPEEDVNRFADALIFNWLIAGTDGHAKNYSMLIASGGRARLAPLYDLASAVPYPQQIPPRKASLAMKVGSHYRIQQIRSSDWKKLARELRLSPGEVFDRIGDLAEKIEFEAKKVAGRMKEENITHPVVARLAEGLIAHVRERLANWGRA
ncbi:MAG: type II toxin-antitoxin system HipA family toxin [Chthoniobacterales bacterium]